MAALATREPTLHHLAAGATGVADAIAAASFPTLEGPIVDPRDLVRVPAAELAAQHRLPAIYGDRRFAEAGGLMAYGPKESDPGRGWRRAAVYVDKLLKGAKPADLPVERPSQFALVLNRKTAQALGLTILSTLLFQADEVIQ